MTITDYSPAQLEVARKTWVFIAQLGLPQEVATMAICCQIAESSLKGPIWWGDKPGWKGAYQQHDNWVEPWLQVGPLDPRRTIGGGTMLFLYGGAGGQPGLLRKVWDVAPTPTPAPAIIQSVQGSQYDGKTDWPGTGVLPFAANYAKVEHDARVMANNLAHDKPTLDLIKSLA